PLAQAALCLDAWLAEEGRDLHPRQRHKAVGLFAINPQQQSALKLRVERITELQDDISHAAVWAAVKEPFAVRSYKYLTVSDYQAAKVFLDNWIARLEKEVAAPQQASLGTRM